MTRMEHTIFRTVLTLAAAFILSGISQVFADDKLTPEQIKFFESKIRPVLVRECYSCHSNQVGQVKGGLWLDTRDALLAGGDSGPAVVPKNLDESILWNAINHVDYVMPPRKKLSDEVLADFKTWIEMGAPDPRSSDTDNVSKMQSTITKEHIEEGRSFWSFKPPVSSALPKAESSWSNSPIDQFIESGLATKGLMPSADADAATMLRRICFDLVGLPPTPKQVEKFEYDYKKDADEAISQLVDSLLAQPQYGERWGRHWLDVARYAESTGRELNLTFPNAWRYRDYVIDAFNDDKPYNEFVQEQIAGDLLPIKSDKEWSEHLVATGFLVLGPKALREQNPRQFELDLIDEQIDVTTRVMLGVSVACARCHDHKFDPIPQTDYYALAGIFKGMSTHFGTAGSGRNRRPSNLIVMPVDDLGTNEKPISKKQLEKLKAELADKKEELRQAIRDRASGSKNAQSAQARILVLQGAVGLLDAQINTYDSEGNPLTFCMAVQETKPTDVRLLERGELNQPGQVVKRGLPQVLCETQVNIPKDSTGRLEFARWVGSKQNPLTARVMVNRIWQHLFVHGIVRTPDDFASTGEHPTHPELLDYLAVKFMDQGWSVKKLIREIVTSRAYRMSSQFNEASFNTDPENKMVWRMTPRRLEAEAIRDAMLAISGNLDKKRPRGSFVSEAGHAEVNNGRIISFKMDEQNDSMEGGESGMRPGMRPQAAGLAGGEGGRLLDAIAGSSVKPRVVQLTQANAPYRSVYLPIVRENIPRPLEVFDFAESTLVISQREISSTPDQGLYFMNNSFVIEQADAMAARLLKESKNINDQIKSAFLLAYGRPATDKELRAATNYYRKVSAAPPAAVRMQFPKHWGEPPAAQTRDLVDLPGNYGQGSSTLRNWIGMNMKKDFQTAREEQRNRRNKGKGKQNQNVVENPYSQQNGSQQIAGTDRESETDDLKLKKLSAVCQGIMASAEFRIVN